MGHYNVLATHRGQSVEFKTDAPTDSELTDDDIIVRFEGETVVGITVLRASQRHPIGKPETDI